MSGFMRAPEPRTLIAGDTECCTGVILRQGTPADVARPVRAMKPPGCRGRDSPPGDPRLQAPRLKRMGPEGKTQPCLSSQKVRKSTLRDLRNDFDVAHYKPDWSSLEAVQAQEGFAITTARQVIAAYAARLLGRKSTENPSDQAS
jgi:hypothetical protein